MIRPAPFAAVCLAAALAPAAATAGCLFTVGPAGETIFEHTKAYLRDPRFGMRFAYGYSPPGALSMVDNAELPDADDRAGNESARERHLLWDVVFGERMPLFSCIDPTPRSARWVRGVELNFDAAAFMLLDFGAQSSAVINSDYLVGLSVDFRPFWDGLDRLSMSTGFQHVSSHLGDEYVLSARTVQGGLEPIVNPKLPYRANPSYLAVPVTVSWDVPSERLDRRLSTRLYAGARFFVESTISEAQRPEMRLGAGLHWDVAPPVVAAGERPLRGRYAVELDWETLIQRPYELRVPPPPNTPVAPKFVERGGVWVTHHARAAFVFQLRWRESPSNALAPSIEYTRGRNQHGQLVAYDEIEQVSLAVSYYW